MTRREAQEILLLYRPGFPDPDDPQFEQAIELAKQDAELSAWFEQHCRLQERLSAALREINVPEGLKEQILSERKVQSLRTRRRVMVAVCAAVVLFAALLIGGERYLSQRNANSFARLRDRMAGDVQRLYPVMDLETNSLSAIEHYLASHHGHSTVTVPSRLAATPATGCAILSWHGKAVSMICFKSNPTAPANKPDLFLFVVNRSDINSPPSETSPQLADAKGLITASWTSGQKVYLLGGFGDEAFLRKFL